MFSKSQVKLIRSLQQKKYRNQLKLFVVEGVKLVNELLLSEFKIHSLFGTGDDETKNLVELYFPVQYKNSVTYISEKELKSISSLATPNRVLAVAEIPDKNEIIPESDLCIALDGIRDPGNLGTIIRNADWFGVKQVICSEDCADIYNQKVVQASMGSIFRVNVNYAKLIDFLTGYHGNIYASVLNGQNIYKTDFSLPAVVLIGNESTGLKNELVKLSTEKLTIPSNGKAESLNAAVACGIMLATIRSRTTVKL